MGQTRATALRRTSILIPLSMLMLMTMMAAMLVGCNTTAGFGEDMQSAGSSIEQKADKNKDN